jgi:erythromycin esterase-like protein
MLTALALALAMLPAQPDPAQPDPARVDWLRRHAIPIATPLAGSGFDDLRPLKDWIGDARIVSLGEPTHGTREAFQMKHRLLEFLVAEMGFSIFSIEASMPESYRLDDFVLRGEGDPREGIRGMYFWTWDTHEVLDMVNWMRGWNAAGNPPVHFTGFDMQTETVAKAIARDLVRRADPDYLPTLDDLYARADADRLTGGGGAGIVTGRLPVALARGKRLTLSGWIRTDALAAFAGLWARVDGPDAAVLAFDNMHSRGPRGTTPWTRYQITLDVPDAATDIYFGALMGGGGGTAWFDDLRVEFGDVSFHDPGALDLSFESGSLKGLWSGTPEFAPAVVDDQPHEGEHCLRLSAPAGVAAPQARLAAEQVLSHLEAREKDLAAATSERDAAWGVQNARVVAQCMRLHEAMATGNADESLQRDFAMAANVKWILDHNPGARIVLWAHNGHVCREEGAMGAFLERLMPGQQVVVGFTTSQGEYQAIRQGQGLTVNPLQTPPRGSVEWHLDGAGHDAMIDPASAWLTAPAPMRMIGAVAMDRQFFPRVVAGRYDLLIHQRRTTAARSLRQVVQPPDPPPEAGKKD